FWRLSALGGLRQPLLDSVFVEHITIEISRINRNADVSVIGLDTHAMGKLTGKVCVFTPNPHAIALVAGYVNALKAFAVIAQIQTSCVLALDVSRQTRSLSNFFARSVHDVAACFRSRPGAGRG